MRLENITGFELIHVHKALCMCSSIPEISGIFYPTLLATKRFAHFLQSTTGVFRPMQVFAMQNLESVSRRPPARPTPTAMSLWESLWHFSLAGTWSWNTWLALQPVPVPWAACLTRWQITPSAAGWSTAWGPSMAWVRPSLPLTPTCKFSEPNEWVLLSERNLVKCINSLKLCVCLLRFVCVCVRARVFCCCYCCFCKVIPFLQICPKEIRLISIKLSTERCSSQPYL